MNLLSCVVFLSERRVNSTVLYLCCRETLKLEFNEFPWLRVWSYTDPVRHNVNKSVDVLACTPVTYCESAYFSGHVISGVGLVSFFLSLLNSE